MIPSRRGHEPFSPAQRAPAHGLPFSSSRLIRSLLDQLTLSAVGYVTGNQERQNEGNIENEKVR